MSAARTAPRISLLSFDATDEGDSALHFVREDKPFAVTLPASNWIQPARRTRSNIQLASSVVRQRGGGRYKRQRSAKREYKLASAKFPSLNLAHIGPSVDDFYLTLGTGIVDPEKDPSWMNAAVYPQVSTTRALPTMRVIGQSARSNDHIQVAPGFFWWASNACCVSFSVPVRVMGSASDWGVLLAFNY